MRWWPFRKKPPVIEPALVRCGTLKVSLPGHHKIAGPFHYTKDVDGAHTAVPSRELMSWFEAQSWQEHVDYRFGLRPIGGLTFAIDAVFPDPKKGMMFKLAWGISN
jgi:hypothetical protein